MADMVQGDAEWLAVRCGRITGSRFRAVLDFHKRTGKPNVGRKRLVETLRNELKTGVPEYTEPNAYMQHGTRCEPMACALYEWERDIQVQHAAWIPHPSIEYVGFSPDGLVGDDGMIEIKSPALEPRHLRTVESQQCPEDYIPQVQGGMWVTGRQWCDFASFWEPTHDLCVVRVHRDETFIQRLAAECAEVWAQVIAQREIAA